MPAAGPRALYLAVVQFVFVSTWTIYIVFLPELLQRAGLDKAWLPRIVIADQVLMAIFDLAFGVAAARGLQRYGRIAPLVLGISLVSCLAFLLLPQMAATAPLLLALTVIWVITSSALRAPLYALLSRHAATPGRAALASMMTLGMAGAGMIAPWLGAQLKPLDPALPFALSSLALAALVLPLAAAERAAGRRADAIEAAAPLPPLPATVFFVLLFAAALGFQIFFNLGAAPAYLKHYGPGDLHWLMPMFWLGVAGGSVLASATATRWPAEGVFAAGALIAAAAALLFGMAPSPALLPLAQVLGGIGWGWRCARPSPLPSATCRHRTALSCSAACSRCWRWPRWRASRSTPPASPSLPCRCPRRSGYARQAAWALPCCARASTEALKSARIAPFAFQIILPGTPWPNT